MFASAEVIPYALPFRELYRSSKGAIESREMVLLRLTGEDGTVGVGEAVPLALRGGESLATVVSELETWAESVTSDRASVTVMATAPARCAIETAIADFQARRKGVPLHALLGSPRARPIRCNATIGADEPKQAAADASAWASDGFTTFKLKVGTGEEDVERVARTREAVGPDARIRIDANGAWSVDEAIETLDLLSPFGIELVEEPVSGLEELAEVRKACGIPVIADESVSTQGDAVEAYRLGACDGVTVKLSKVGTLDLRPGRVGPLPVYLSSALDGPVGIAAAAHVAQTLPEDGPLSNLAQGLATSRLFDATIAASGPELDGDLLAVPPGPGLGVEIDESALDRFRL